MAFIQQAHMYICICIYICVYIYRINATEERKVCNSNGEMVVGEIRWIAVLKGVQRKFLPQEVILESISNSNELVSSAALGGRHSSQEVTVQRTPGERSLVSVGLQGGHGLNWREQGRRGYRLSQSCRRLCLWTL